MGFDREGWRMDDAVHPFAAGIGAGDVRITSRWDESYFASGLYGAMHECGHGLYEAGIAPALRAPRSATASRSACTSRRAGCGRTWSAAGGRSAGSWPAASAALYGGGAAPDAEALFRAVNKVSPSYIRVEADEATYGLHVILRFELEQELIEGRLPVAELPQEWNRRFHEMFGLEVTDDADGVLQDVHWSAGLIGYFPTYALGNLIAGQLWARVHDEVAGHRGADRRGRARAAARVAARPCPPPRREVLDRRAARAGRGRADRGRAVRDLSQGRSSGRCTGSTL